MCGRFTSTTPASDLASFFDAETELVDGPARYNVTPTSDVFVVREREDGQRVLESFFWGLVPRWAESPSVGSRMINARSESAAEKPSFRSAFRTKRCIIPVDGFYEWIQVPERRKKQPVYISSTSGEPLAFAGLWEQWRPRSGTNDDVLHSCAILTGPPNALIEPLHDRMPMILASDDWSNWMDPDRSVEDLQSLLRPAPEGLLQWWPVSLRVNDVRSHDVSLIEPVAITPDGEAEGQGRLL